MADPDVPSSGGSLPQTTDGSETEETQSDDGSDQGSVTSELSTGEYDVSLKDDLAKALDKLKLLPLSAVRERSNSKPLRHTLRKWLQQPQRSRKNGFYYPFDYAYADSSIILNTLTGSDKVIGRQLDSLSKKLNFQVYIAELERKEVGYAEIDHSTAYDRYSESEEESEEEEESFHFMEQVVETNQKVKLVRDMHGRPVVGGLALDLDKDLLMREEERRDVFEDIEPEEYEEETEGWYGNSGPPLTHWYRTHAFLLVPTDSVSRFFTDNALDLSNDTLSSLIGYGARASLRYTKLDEERAELLFEATRNFCDKLWETENEGRRRYQSEPAKIDGDDVANILKVSLELEDYDFVETVCMMHGAVVPASFFTWAKDWLKDSEDSDFDEMMETGFTSIIEQYPHFPDQVIALGNLTHKCEEAGWSAGLRARVCAWAHDKRMKCLKDTLKRRGLAGDDGKFIVYVAMKDQDPLRFLFNCVIPFLDPSRHSVAFFTSLINWLWKTGSTCCRVSVDDLKPFCKTLAKRFLASADFSKATCIGGLELEYANTNKRQRTSRSSPSKTEKPTPELLRMTINSEILLNFYNTLTKISTADDEDNLAILFITKLNDAVPRLPIDHMHDLWLPFHVKLIPKLTANGATRLITTPAYQSLYRSMLSYYIKNYVGKEPAHSTSLVRPRVNCRGCIDCRILNAFLQSPTERMDRFQINKERRKHIHQQLDYHKIDCTHVSERGTTPYTLAITKTFKQQAQQLREWKERKEFAERKIRQFSRYPALKALLGNHYDKIVGLEDAYIESPRAAAAKAAVARAAASTAAAAAAGASNNNSAVAARTASSLRPVISATGHVRGGYTSRAGAASGSSSRYNPPPVAGVRRRRSITFDHDQNVIDLTADD